MQVISTFSRWNRRHGPLVWTPGLSERETDFWSAAGSGFRTCYAKENVEASNDSNVSLSFGVSFLAHQALPSSFSFQAVDLGGSMGFPSCGTCMVTAMSMLVKLRKVDGHLLISYPWCNNSSSLLPKWIKMRTSSQMKLKSSIEKGSLSLSVLCT